MYFPGTTPQAKVSRVSNGAIELRTTPNCYTAMKQKTPPRLGSRDN